MKEVNISEVQLAFIKPQDGLIAFASIVLNDQIYLGSIGVYKKLLEDDYRITYPTKKIGTNSLNIFHPINRDLGTAIEQAIKQKVKDVISKTRKLDENEDVASCG